MKIVLAPDSFKGTMSAREVCQIEEKAIKEIMPDAQVVSISMADGGEGMADAYLELLGGERICMKVTGPDGRPVDAYYVILPDGTAVIEMAQASGLTLMEEKNPLTATTRGTGELIRDAMDRGVKRAILGLGGSATNDCGIGMAGVLGFVFKDKDDKEIEPAAVNLKRIEKIILPEREQNMTIEASCDVDNPLLGPDGATYTFGPQKGADEEMLEVLEEGMEHFAYVLEEATGKEMDVPGAGAAGGMGAAVIAFLDGRLRSGSELLLDAAAFDEAISDADLVITGEGRIDWQSAHGKVPSAVGKRCLKNGIRCIAICGSRGKGADEIRKCGVEKIYVSSENDDRTMAEIMKSCREELEKLTKEIMRMENGR